MLCRSRHSITPAGHSRQLHLTLLHPVWWRRHRYDRCQVPILMETIKLGRAQRMAAPRKYPEELRERAIRMRLGRPGRPGVRSGGGCPVGAQLGMIADTLRGWVTQAEVDAGGRPGTTTPTPRTWSIWIGRTASCVEPTRSADGVGFLGGGARPPLPVIINYIERSRTCSELIRSAPR